MACKFSNLPPSKRYRLQHELESQTPSPSCLPAKKRKEARSCSPAVLPPPPPTTVCLPAKKRIWASPPSKRYRLQHEQESQTLASTPSPSCLPAKKRKEARSISPVVIPPPPPPTTVCLPAKKRIWALHEFDLNLEFQPPSVDEKKPQEVQSEEKIRIQTPKLAGRIEGEGAEKKSGDAKKIHLQTPMAKKLRDEPSEEKPGDGNSEEKIQIQSPPMAKKLRDEASKEKPGDDKSVVKMQIQTPPMVKKLRDELSKEKPKLEEKIHLQTPVAKKLRDEACEEKPGDDKSVVKVQIQYPTPMAKKLRELSEDEGSEEEDDGILCAICESTDADPSDPIVFCDGCELMVHASCYGHPLADGIPEGDWFCAECQSSSPPNKASLKCCLCPVLGGALKPTTEEGKWAHVVCALFVPEVFFRDPEGREGIDMSQVPSKRWKHKCYICKSRNGCAIDCSEERCPLAFHVTCGIKNDLCIEYKEGKNRTDVVAGFCRTHSDIWRKQQKSGKYKIVPEK